MLRVCAVPCRHLKRSFALSMACVLVICVLFSLQLLRRKGSQQLIMQQVHLALDWGVTERPLGLSASQTPPITSVSSEEASKLLHPVSNTSVECLFSGAQPVVGVDVQMVDVLDTLPFDNPKGGAWDQGFEITYSMTSFEEHPLRVIIVPHSHIDPGWIKTFDEYYRSQTRNILNLMTDALIANSNLTFIWSEISFLDVWWQEQTQSRKEQFRKLVERGQLEIVTGGWVMTDEASAHYFAMIDQMIEGHLWMQENLPGIAPKTGWAIDPFGYSSTMPYLLRAVGLDAMVIHRVHYAVKKHLAWKKQLEFGWKQLWNQESSTDDNIFCHLMPFYGYNSPFTCGPSPRVCCQFDFVHLLAVGGRCPWNDQPKLITDANIAERAETLADQYRKKAQLYRTNVLLVPLGADFQYSNQPEIDMQFSNYKKLIHFMNSHPEMRLNIQYGTLSDYFTAVRAEAGSGVGPVPRGFPSLTGDFFTYADRNDNFWSGYYTSRPFYKRLSRVLETNLRSAEILYSLAHGRGLNLYPDLSRQLLQARRSLGLFQHHDAITGTAKDKVVDDYAKRLTEGIAQASKVMAFSVQALLTGAHNETLYFDHVLPSLPYQTVAHIRTSVASHSLVLFNPLPQPRMQLVSIKVDRAYVTVQDSLNMTVACQIMPVWVEHRVVSEQEFELVFSASLGPLELSRYQLLPGKKGCVLATLQIYSQYPIKNTIFPVEVYAGTDIVLRTAQLEAQFSGFTGLLRSVILADSTKVDVEVDFVWYGTRPSREKSGAYLFLPDMKARSLLIGLGRPPVIITTGPLVQEVTTFLRVVTHSLRLLSSPGHDGHSLTITNTVDITKEKSNLEVVMRLRTSIANPEGIFYTDLNGLQLARRRTMDKLPIQGNFYPMATSAVLQDNSTRLSLLSQQPLGVAALEQGWLEVVLDRQLRQDDSRGLGQGVTDNRVTTEVFRLLIEQRLSTSNVNPMATLVYPSLWAHFSLDELLHPTQAFIAHPQTIVPPSCSLLQAPFPCDLHLVNLRSLLGPGATPPQSAALILHRRGFDCGFTATPLQCGLSGGKVELAKVFKGVELLKAIRTTLSLFYDKETLSSEMGLPTHLEPMDIQTYRLAW